MARPRAFQHARTASRHHTNRLFNDVKSEEAIAAVSGEFVGRHAFCKTHFPLSSARKGLRPTTPCPLSTTLRPRISMLRRLRGQTWDSEPEEPEGGESSPERVLAGLRALWQASPAPPPGGSLHYQTPVKQGGDASPGAEDHCDLADCSWAAVAKPGAGTPPAQKAQGQAAGGSPPGGCPEPPPCREF